MTQTTMGAGPPGSVPWQALGERALKDRLCVFFDPLEVELAVKAFTGPELEGFAKGWILSDGAHLKDARICHIISIAESAGA